MDTENPSAAPASPYGLAAVVLGVLLVIAGPVVLAVAILPQLAPTIGPAPLSFWPTDPPDDRSVLPLGFGAVILPLAGFSLAYLNAATALRRRISAVCAGWFGTQTVLLSAAVLWITGGGQDAASLLGASSDDSAVVIAAPAGLLLGAAAATIMFVLSTRTNFDAQSDDYFAQGNTVVRVRPLPVALHALWFTLGAAVWAFVLWFPMAAQARVESLELGSSAPADLARPWPWYPHGDFEFARAVYAVTLGIIVGAVASSLIKKVLYRTVLRGLIGRPVPAATQNSWRGIQQFLHYPIAVSGASATACLLFLYPVEKPYDDDLDVTSITVFGVIAGIGLIAGLAMISSVWRSGDHPLYDSALQRAVAGDVGASFRTPERRKRVDGRRKRAGAKGGISRNT